MNKEFFRVRFRFSTIVARRLKITKFTANRTKSIKGKYNRQQDNTIQSYSRVDYNEVQYSEWQQGRLC